MTHPRLQRTRRAGRAERTEPPAGRTRWRVVFGAVALMAGLVLVPAVAAGQADGADGAGDDGAGATVDAQGSVAGGAAESGEAGAVDSAAAGAAGSATAGAAEAGRRSAVGSGGVPIRRSWTGDSRELREGDVVTVLVDEVLVASADQRRTTTRDRNRNVDVRAGTGSTTAGGGLRTENDVSERVRGESSTRERFSAELSARVVEVGPGGLARIEGVKRLQIDEHQQEVTLRGWIRAADLSTENTIESWRIANPEIHYGSNGELRSSGGIWSWIVDHLVP